MTVKYTIRGLTELKAAFDAVQRDLDGAQDAQFGAVIPGIVSDARSGMPAVSGAARGSIQPADGGISFGDVPYQPWLDFGGSVGVGSGRIRPYVKGGRYLYPAFGRADGRLADAAGDGVLNAARAHSFDVKR